MAEAPKYEKGQVIVVGGKQRVISKVGREYGYYGVGTTFKFSLTTGYTVTERGTRDYVYPSIEAHRADMARHAAWVGVRYEVGKRYSSPENFDATEEGLTELYRLLGIERPAKTTKT